VLGEKAEFQDILEELEVAERVFGACTGPRKCYHYPVNSKQRRTLEAVWSDPVDGNIEWVRIESLFRALGCRVVEGPGSSVTFEWQGRRATFHRPHPGKEALRYRVKTARELLERMGIKP